MGALADFSNRAANRRAWQPEAEECRCARRVAAAGLQQSEEVSVEGMPMHDLRLFPAGAGHELDGYKDRMR